MNIQFILNDQDCHTEEKPGRLVLDYLRRNVRFTGTKEGCKEGDCGACVVLIGERKSDRITYQPITACLMPVIELQGKHLVTIEGLNMSALSPVQQAIVDEGATQCGFCTPGIVVSLTGYLMRENIVIDNAGIKKALGGHLCRCTGYRSLKAVADHLHQKVGRRTGVAALVKAGWLPEYFTAIPARLKHIPAPTASTAGNSHSSGTCFYIAGGTDLYVQQGDKIADGSVFALNLNPNLKGITINDDSISVGASTTFEEFAADGTIRKMLPDIDDTMHLIASLQIRNRATLGGNIVNASPIADMTIALLALASELELAGNRTTRRVPLSTFYRGYKQMDLQKGELLQRIHIPRFNAPTRFHFEKVSRRTCLDIASVNSAIKIAVDKNNIRSVALAVGGVAPIPLLLQKTCDFLTGKPLTPQTVVDGLDIAQTEINPISDIRGSADYKRLLLRQLMIGHFLMLFPKNMTITKFYAFG